MNKLVLVGLALVTLTALSQASPLYFTSEEDCKPGKNCKAPECRCPDDPKRPGDFDNPSTPMMILLTFGYGFNNHTVKEYMKLFRSIKNPNNCQAKGTFFVQEYNSDLDTVKDLYEKGHEMAINSINGEIPTNEKEWLNSVETVGQFLKKAGVPLSNVTGLRGPDNWFGGDDEFNAMKQTDLTFDSSCVTLKENNPLWPFTTDYVKNMTSCSLGRDLTKAFKGIWEFPVNALRYKDLVCPLPSGCIPAVNTTDAVFRMFINSFNVHYYGNRAPFILDIDPQWVTEEFRVMGTKQFLELVEAYPDTWILTVSQALEWIKNPVAMGPFVTFKPWGC